VSAPKFCDLDRQQVVEPSPNTNRRAKHRGQTRTAEICSRKTSSPQ